MLADVRFCGCSPSTDRDAVGPGFIDNFPGCVVPRQSVAPSPAVRPYCQASLPIRSDQDRLPAQRLMDLEITLKEGPGHDASQNGMANEVSDLMGDKGQC